MGSIDRFPVSPEEREACRERAEVLRAFSRELIARCMQLRVHAELQMLAPEADGHYHDAETALCDSVRELGRLFRRMDTPPQDAVIEVKRLVRDAAAEICRRPPYAERELTADVVAWTIEAYFAAD